jgi:hypothetical protein
MVGMGSDSSNGSDFHSAGRASRSSSDDWASWAFSTASTLASQGLQTATVLAAKSKEVANNGLAQLQDSGYLDTIKGSSIYTGFVCGQRISD